jgi:hypothetical protein
MDDDGSWEVLDDSNNVCERDRVRGTEGGKGTVKSQRPHCGSINFAHDVSGGEGAAEISVLRSVSYRKRREGGKEPGRNR